MFSDDDDDKTRQERSRDTFFQKFQHAKDSKVWKHLAPVQCALVQWGQNISIEFTMKLFKLL